MASHTGSVPTLIEEISSPYDGDLGTAVGNQIDTGSILFNIENKISKKIHIEVSSATSSTPTLSTQVFETKDGILNFIGNDTLADTLNESFVNLSDNWGTSSNDIHFIHTATGSEGKYGDYNTYHYEKRYIFNIIGDVESVSGSYPGISSSFETDFTGIVTSGVFTASKHFNNQTFVQSDIGLGLRPLGTTVEFKSSSSLPPPHGKFLDEQFVYPKNHQFLLGTSKDGLDGVIYTGTQNQGGDTIESEAFIDLSTDSFYYISTTGGSGYTIQYE